MHLQLRDIIKSHLHDKTIFNNDNFLYISYEELVTDPGEYSTKIANFIEDEEFSMDYDKIDPNFTNISTIHNHHKSLSEKVNTNSIGTFEHLSYEDQKYVCTIEKAFKYFRNYTPTRFQIFVLYFSVQLFDIFNLIRKRLV